MKCFYAQANKWLKTDPTTEIRVVVTGFSRGAATARHFMNRVEKTWYQDFGAAGAPNQEMSPRFYAILYDTVAKFQGELELALPASADYVVHFIANDEVQSPFKPLYDEDDNFLLVPTSTRIAGPRASHSERMTVVMMPGAHSDIGSSYSKGIGSLYLSLTEGLLYQMGLIETNCWDISIEVFNAGMHDSRGWWDRLIGTPAPDYRRTRREYLRQQAAFMSPEARIRLASRVQSLYFKAFDLGRPAIRNTYRSDGPAFHLKRVGEEIEVVALEDNWVDPYSIRYARDEANQRRLYYAYRDHPGKSTFIITDTMLDMLIPGQVAVLSLSFLKRDARTVVFFFIDDVWAGEIVMAPHGSEQAAFPPKCTIPAKRAPAGKAQRDSGHAM